MEITYTKSCTNMKCRHFGRIWSGYQVERFRSYAWEWLQKCFYTYSFVLQIITMYEIIYELHINESLQNAYTSICEILDYKKGKFTLRDLAPFSIMHFGKKIKQFLFPVQTFKSSDYCKFRILRRYLIPQSCCSVSNHENIKP